MVLMWSIWV